MGAVKRYVLFLSGVNGGYDPHPPHGSSLPMTASNCPKQKRQHFKTGHPINNGGFFRLGARLFNGHHHTYGAPGTCSFYQCCGPRNKRDGRQIRAYFCPQHGYNTTQTKRRMFKKRTMVEVNGFEPMAFCVQGRRSTN